jgi:hypothetical protein
MATQPNILTLQVYRLSSNADSTLGAMFLKRETGERKYLCFTLEDEYREEKVMAETRIPAGTYDIKLRTTGGYHAKYNTRFADIHKGMLWLQDVPNFEYILIHCGNTDEHTGGCLLVGYAPKRVKGGEYELYNSTQAYFDVYPLVADHLDSGGMAQIEIIDFDEVDQFLG